MTPSVAKHLKQQQERSFLVPERMVKGQPPALHQEPKQEGLWAEPAVQRSQPERTAPANHSWLAEQVGSRSSINDEWLPRQQPPAAFHLPEPREHSSSAVRGQAGQEGAPASPPLPWPGPGALSVRQTRLGRRGAQETEGTDVRPEEWRITQPGERKGEFNPELTLAPARSSRSCDPSKPQFPLL